MEKQIGLTTEELDSIFAQIKNGKTELDQKVYNAYLPLISDYASKFKLKEEQVQDLYNEVFIYVYNNILKEVVQPSNFTVCFENVLAKQCMKCKTESKDEFNSKLLSMSYAKHMQSREAEEARREEKKVISEQSLMYVIQILTELEKNEEFAKANGLSELKVDMIKDYYGLNAERKRLTIDQIAQKYELNESRAKAMMVAGLKKLRDMKEFNPIKAQLK